MQESRGPCLLQMLQGINNTKQLGWRLEGNPSDLSPVCLTPLLRPSVPCTLNRYRYSVTLFPWPMGSLQPRTAPQHISAETGSHPSSFSIPVGCYKSHCSSSALYLPSFFFFDNSSPVKKKHWRIPHRNRYRCFLKNV